MMNVANKIYFFSFENFFEDEELKKDKDNAFPVFFLMSAKIDPGRGREGGANFFNFFFQIWTCYDLLQKKLAQ